MAIQALPIHPQHRVVILLVLAVLLPLSLPLMVVVIHGSLLWLCYRLGTLGDWWRTVLRLKWLMISLFVLYGWFTPGLPLWEIAGVNMPTREGLTQAGYRALLLSSLVAAVMWSIKPLSADVLAVSLSRLLGLLRWVGLNTDPLVRRLALAMHTVADLQQQLVSRKQQGWLEATGQVLLAAERGELPLAQGVAETSDEIDSQGQAVVPFPTRQQYGWFVLLLGISSLFYGLSVTLFTKVL